MTQVAYGTGTTASAGPYAAALGRALLAATFLISGFAKLYTAGETIDDIASAGLPLPMLAYLVSVAVELGGGLLLVAGYQTRIVAAVMTLFVLATAFAFHGNIGDPYQTIHFLKNISIAGGMLQVVAFGAGAISVDAWRGRA